MIEPDRLFHLPLGVDFAAELVRGLRERLADRPPEAMARVRLFVNSRRMKARVTREFVLQGPGYLPQIDVVSDLEADPILADLPPPVPALRRRLDLARLVGALLAASPDLAPQSARFDLAESLRLLLAEMQDEGVSAARIQALDVSGHAALWARTQAFLKIVAPLALGLEDVPSRQREAVRRLGAAWRQAPPQDPVVIAGSTGSRGTTALLMQEVARLTQGAVVVPGFDHDMPGAIWEAMDDALTSEDHPQFRYRRLMDLLGAGPADFRPWRGGAPVDGARNRVISLALRPAPVTDQWLVEGQDLPDLTGAMAGVTLVEAPGPREEASAIALAIRAAVEKGQKAALITPDRQLARRVAAALARWEIVADDPAGSPLALSAPGRFLRLVAEAMASPLTADRLLALLKHPLAASGAGRRGHLSMVRRLEAHLRRHGPTFPTAPDLMQWAGEAPEALRWARALGSALDLIAAPPAGQLAEHVARHRAIAEALARGAEPEGSGALWAEAPGEAALALMCQMADVAEDGDAFALADYLHLFETLIQEGAVRLAPRGHPLVSFHGHREAREMAADVVILGGLTDGIWPGTTAPDPWLNRRMRRDAGLLLPERQIGLAAHDFQQAMAAPEVVLTRARRDAEAETVPSRWLNRLMNLMAGLPGRGGPRALQDMRARGDALLVLARALERPDQALQADPRLQPAPRPAPSPPIATRPKELSLTRISTLIRDPYAIYARYVLNLRPLDPLRREAEGRERGQALHKVLEEFVRSRPDGEPEALARKRLLAIAETVLAKETPYPSARVLWRARLERAAGHLFREEAKHDGKPVLLEARGRIEVADTGFVLSGTPDRIDLLPDGRLHLVDYKNGTPPNKAMQESFDKQLILAAAMAERGGFAGLGKAEVAMFTYIGLGAGEKAEKTEVAPGMLEEQWERFVQLIENYQDRDTGYRSRRAVHQTMDTGDYDHLARYGEWAMTEPSVWTLVGGRDDA